MPGAAELALTAAAVGSGLVAGLCFTFQAFVLRALDALGPGPAVRAMQSINAAILRSAAMAVWFGTLVVGACATVLADERDLPLAATALYAVGAVVITARENVPLNEALDRVDASAPEAASEWSRYRARWARWNGRRTACLTAACTLFTLAA